MVGEKGEVGDQGEKGEKGITGMFGTFGEIGKTLGFILSNWSLVYEKRSRLIAC